MLSIWSAAALVAAGLLVAIAVCVADISRRIRRDGRPGPLTHADAILVFGAGVWATGPSLSLRVRVARAAEVFKEGWAPIILCSGGWSGGSSEASVMRDMLVGLGVPADSVIPDDGGITTWHGVRSGVLFGRQRGWHRVIAVSSWYHMHRIRLYARTQRLDVVLCPAIRSGPRTPGLLAFDLRQHLREIQAVGATYSRRPCDALLRTGPGRQIRRAARHLGARVRFLMGEADAVVDASDEIGEQIKQGIAGFSDTAAVASPAASSLVWPVPGQVMSRFGIRHRRLHAGVDLRAAYGSIVRASDGGGVLLAGQVGPYGNVIVINHGAGLATVYAHLAGSLVRKGETIRGGQPVGFIGETGRSFGPHLHFEVRVHGAPVDPLVYLSTSSLLASSG